MKTYILLCTVLIVCSCSLEGERKLNLDFLVKDDLIIWLDSSDVNGDESVFTNLAPVITWVDKSGNGNDADGSASSPTYKSNSLNGLGIISFSEGEWLNIDLGTLDSPTTIIALCRFGHGTQPGGNDDYVISSGQNNPNSMISIARYRNSGNTDMYTVNSGANAYHYGPVLSGSRWYILSQITNTSAPYLTARIDSTQVPVDDFAAASTTNGEIGIGYFRALGNQHFLGDIAEIFIYDRSLSASEIAAMEMYLQIKWGL